LKQLRQVAVRVNSNINELANTALCDYLDRLAEQKITAESQAFEAMYPELAANYLGEFVAIHEGRVVDNDADFEALFLRVQARFEQTPVLIRQVTDSPTLDYHARRPRLEPSND
jgi:hypothetical protein